MSNIKLSDNVKISLGLAGSFSLGVVSYKLYQDYFTKNGDSKSQLKPIKDESSKNIGNTTKQHNELDMSDNVEPTSNLILEAPELAILGDIGGTKCRFVLYSMDIGDCLENTRMCLNTHDYVNLEAAQSDYIKICKGKSESFNPSCACLCIAGSLHNNCLKEMANAPWRDNNGNTIAVNLGFKYIKLLNDFEAIGYAMGDLDPRTLTPLNPKFSKLDPTKMITVVGPGTGLGVGFQNSIEVNKKRHLQVR